jgi:F-type H+-transporting ATPase subunit gamma
MTKLRKEQVYFEKYKDFIYVLDNLKKDFDFNKYNFRKKLKDIIIITSNKGLCGAFNLNLFKFAKDIYDKSENSNVIIFGDQGFKISKKYKVNVYKFFNDLSKLDYIIEKLLNDFDKDREIYLVYNKFFSATNLKPYCEKLLPFDEYNKRQIIYDSNKDDVLFFFVKNYIKEKIYFSIVESNICENSARMLFMKSASDSAKEIISNLKLNYNRERQNKITQQMVEIINN